MNVEYVSANPTGPLHAAHARGAVLGDAMAGLLDFCGWDVTREYYVNDAGAQVDVLARSAYLRYCEALGRDIGEIPSGLYPGDYLVEVGEKLAESHGEAFLDADEAAWLEPVRSFTIEAMMEGVRADLTRLGISMYKFSSERTLVDKGAVAAAIERLTNEGHVYRGVLEPPKGKEPEDWEPRAQLLFRASAFGDDTDRPLQKSDGSWTYFASDVAYHMDKLDRTGGPLINIFGVDHGGYVKRMNAAVEALSGRKDMLDIRLCQLVTLMDNGRPVKMSKRAGTFVTVRDVIESVGADVIRFIMLTRRSEQTLDFDFAKVTEQSRDNPVFYVQYA
ncbi:MAG: arginine--tRNA ligase, partial [Pseudomonadota bacterium]|nr:arginine--tRNA ligase [Pseudomonadota bacterium]